jgi:hypothetical protein
LYEAWGFGFYGTLARLGTRVSLHLDLLK